jgi:uncharacterized protein YutE (UPF0331/DUF86 family)
MELNREMIRKRFEDIREALDRLERIRALSKEEFLGNQDIQDIACYRLLVAIEAAIHICFHISAQGLHRVPDSYAECFQILAEEGLISFELSQNLQKMARFRNLLIHVYWAVDYETVYEILHTGLDDLRLFMKAVTESLLENPWGKNDA